MEPAVTLPNPDIHLLYNTPARRSSYCSPSPATSVLAGVCLPSRAVVIRAAPLPENCRAANEPQLARQLRVREEAAGEKDVEGLRSEQLR